MVKKEFDEKHMHDGHRARLFKTAFEAGLDNLSDIQIVELLLMYIIPRKDVNPLAHRLLHRYETLSNILSASVNDLASVEGLNEASAIKISVLNEIFFQNSLSFLGKKIKLKTVSDIYDLVEACLRYKNVENMLLIALSPTSVVTHKRFMSSESASRVSFSVEELANFFSSAKPASLIIAHCHPFGSATPSVSDVEGVSRVSELCHNFGINFIDAYIVGDDGIYSHADDMLVRKYLAVDNLADNVIGSSQD